MATHTQITEQSPFYSFSALNRDERTDPYRKLLASGILLSMTVLEDKDLAAGTNAKTVDLFNVSALQANGPTDPYQKLIASGNVYSLTVLEDTGLAAGTYAKP